MTLMHRFAQLYDPVEVQQLFPRLTIQTFSFVDPFVPLDDAIVVQILIQLDASKALFVLDMKRLALGSP